MIWWGVVSNMIVWSPLSGMWIWEYLFFTGIGKIGFRRGTDASRWKYFHGCVIIMIFYRPLLFCPLGAEDARAMLGNAAVEMPTTNPTILLHIKELHDSIDRKASQGHLIYHNDITRFKMTIQLTEVVGIMHSRTEQRLCFHRVRWHVQDPHFQNHGRCPTCNHMDEFHMHDVPGRLSNQGGRLRVVGLGGTPDFSSPRAPSAHEESCTVGGAIILSAGNRIESKVFFSRTRVLMKSACRVAGRAGGLHIRWSFLPFLGVVS